MKKKQDLPFGLWPSPVSAWITSHRLRINDIQWDGSGKRLLIHEGRGDRGVVVDCPLDDARRDLTEENNVRGGVGYGGGEFSVQGEWAVFCDKNGRLYKTSLTESGLTPLTPAFGKTASPAISPDGKRVIFVFSDDQTDLLGLVDAEGLEWPIKLAEGADFYMQPTWHPDSKRLAWIEWRHPNMPWDGALLKLARLDDDQRRIVDEQTIAGDIHQPVSQPLFSPDGRWLSYIASNGQWEDLVLYDLQSGFRLVLYHGVDRMCSEPAWVQGAHSYGWSFSSQKIYSILNAHGQAELWEIPLDGNARQLDTTPYTWLSQLSVAPHNDQLAFIASAPEIPERAVYSNGQKMVIVARSENENLDQAFFSKPEELSWKAKDGRQVFGWFYPPCHPLYTHEGRPPCIVYIHGGPTSTSLMAHNPQRTYFTSRGYAWFELNYRGSAGYGRDYMEALYGHWGEADTEDAGDAAAFLKKSGLTDPDRLAILGGSAGGYLVLNALIRFPGLYRAAVCNYGVSNLFSLAMDTHKFEAHYTDRLVGTLPEASALYQAWSPVFHADRIKDPIAIFQGSDDRVVPPSQSEEIVTALRRLGVPYMYQVYEGEGHGFRKNETLNDYYQQVERFLKQHLLFSPKMD